MIVIDICLGTLTSSHVPLDDHLGIGIFNSQTLFSLNIHIRIGILYVKQYLYFSPREGLVYLSTCQIG